MVIDGILPLCFTPEAYVERPEFISAIADFVRSRPPQPLDAFMAQSDAALNHDASAVLGDIGVPTLITVGAHDLVCSPRYAKRMKGTIAGSRMVVFDHLSHGGLHEDPETFNRATLDFLLQQA
jgi:pimeloyl-ACP methyl ester carboxylesterase